MKYICLGFIEEGLWDGMSESDQKVFIEKCLVYDVELHKSGHMRGGEALQNSKTATTIRYRNGKVSITDGPFAETKEQLGGIMILEAENLDQAIRLMSNHPSVQMGGSWEIRPANETINSLYDKTQQSGIRP
jgi:hypothetical protein